jgi:hypothetical protein
LVVEKIELRELGELADRLGQRAQLVVGKIELLELGELADRLRQRAQLVAAKIGVPTVSGQKTTLSQCGIGLSQRAGACAKRSKRNAIMILMGSTSLSGRPPILAF